MPLSGSAARRYAEALFDIAVAEKAVDPYRASFDRLAAGINGRALRTLGDPSIPMEARQRAIAAAAKDEPHAVRSLVAILVRRDRITLLPAIARAFGDLVDQRAGIAKARITTAIDLDADLRRAFVERLERSSGTRLAATFAVDPTLIGGATVQVGDHLVDASLRAQLDDLRTQLSAVGE